MLPSATVSLIDDEEDDDGDDEKDQQSGEVTATGRGVAAAVGFEGDVAAAADDDDGFPQQPAVVLVPTSPGAPVTSNVLASNNTQLVGQQLQALPGDLSAPPAEYEEEDDLSLAAGGPLAGRVRLGWPARAAAGYTISSEGVFPVILIRVFPVIVIRVFPVIVIRVFPVIVIRVFPVIVICGQPFLLF
jgi:hypothetical protein